MALEEFTTILVSLKRKLMYLGILFGAGALISFPFMGSLIKKIKNDMLGDLISNQNPNQDLLGISRNITAISQHLEEISRNTSISPQDLSNISQNLTSISQQLGNISNLNFHGPTFVYLTPMEVLMLELKMSLVFAALITMPLAIYYAYIGLGDRLKGKIEVSKKFALIVLLSVIGLFFLGAVYSYSLMLPLFIKYLYLDAANIGIVANFSIYEFVYFVTLTTIVFGVAFELPVIMLSLIHFGITSREALARYRRHAYVVLLIIAAWITPGPDIFSQLMVTVPFIILYEVSLIVARFVRPKQQVKYI